MGDRQPYLFPPGRAVPRGWGGWSSLTPGAGPAPSLTETPSVAYWAARPCEPLHFRGRGSRGDYRWLLCHPSADLEDEVFLCSFSLNEEQSGSLVVETKGNRASCYLKLLRQTQFLDLLPLWHPFSSGHLFSWPLWGLDVFHEPREGLSARCHCCSGWRGWRGLAHARPHPEGAAPSSEKEQHA